MSEKKEMEEYYKKTMESLQREKDLMENEFNEQTEMLKDMIQIKDKELNMLRKENKDLKSNKKGNSISESLYDDLKEQYDALNRNYENMKEENASLQMNIDVFEEEIKKSIKEKKEMRNQINELTQSNEEKNKSNINLLEENKSMKTQIFELEKKLDIFQKEIKNYKNELNTIKIEKDNMTTSTKELMIYNTKLKEENDIMKQLNKSYQEAMESNKNINKEEPKNIPEKKPVRHNSIISTKDERNNELLYEILSDYLVKTNMNQYSINAFKIVENIMINIPFIDDTLQNIRNTESINNELLLVIYSDIRKYFLNNLEKIQDIKFKNYLEQCSIIKQIDYDKDIVELIKKVKYFNDQNSRIFECYKKKKEMVYKIAENNFEIIKNHFIKNYCENNNHSTLNNFKTIRSIFMFENNELIINFTNIKKDLINDDLYSLYPFFIKNRILNINKLKIHFNSDFNIKEDLMLLIYISKFYNKNIISLSLFFETNENENLSNIFKTKLSLLINLLPNLNTLELKNINLFTNKIDANNFIKTIINSKIINLSFINCLKQSALYYLYLLLSQKHNIISLNISENFGSELLIAIDGLLNQQKELLSLNLSVNNLNFNEYGILSKYLMDDNTKLKELIISDNIITVESANLLGMAFKKLKTLEILNISNCKISTDEFNFLINKETTKSITQLILDFNNIGNTGIAALISYLKECTNISKLSLKKCNVTLASFSLLKMIVSLMKINKLEIFLENNTEIENEQFYNTLMEGESLKDKNIIIYLRKFYCTEPILSKLKKIDYLKFN